MRGKTRAISVAEKRQGCRHEREREFNPRAVRRRGRPRGRRRGRAAERGGERVVVIASRREIRKVRGDPRRFGVGSFATETPPPEGIVGDVRRAKHRASFGGRVFGEESRAKSAASEDARAVRATRGEERGVAGRHAGRHAGRYAGRRSEETREGGVDVRVVDGGVRALDAEGGVHGGGDDVARVRDGEPRVGVVVGWRGVGERAKEEERAVADEVEVAIRRNLPHGLVPRFRKDVAPQGFVRGGCQVLGRRGRG